MFFIFIGYPAYRNTQPVYVKQRSLSLSYIYNSIVLYPLISLTPELLRSTAANPPFIIVLPSVYVMWWNIHKASVTGRRKEKPGVNGRPQGRRSPRNPGTSTNQFRYRASPGRATLSDQVRIKAHGRWSGRVEVNMFLFGMLYEVMFKDSRGWKTLIVLKGTPDYGADYSLIMDLTRIIRDLFNTNNLMFTKILTVIFFFF